MSIEIRLGACLLVAMALNLIAAETSLAQAADAGAFTVSNGWLIPKPSTPGVELRLIRLEAADYEHRQIFFGAAFTRTPGLTTLSIDATYGIEAVGFPPGKTYWLWTYQLGNDPTRLAKLLVDESGEMMIEELRDKGLPEGPSPLRTGLALDLVAFMVGEPYEIGLISEDQTVQAYAKDFPFPIQDRDGECHIYLELMEPLRLAFLAVGQGFRPNEELVTESRSGREEVKDTPLAEEDGRFVGMLMPQTQNRRRGSARFSVVAELCSLEVEYEWGRRR